MGRIRVLIVLAALAWAGAFPVAAEEAAPGFAAGDTVKSLLGKYEGKRVTLQLASGQELTGKVASVGEHMVHLAELSGREFFDGVVALDQVAAVIVRTRDR